VKVSVKLIQEMNLFYNLGNNMQTVGAKFGVCKSTVAKYIWEPRKHGTRIEHI
jgi:hypothetical protein